MIASWPGRPASIRNDNLNMAQCWKPALRNGIIGDVSCRRQPVYGVLTVQLSVNALRQRYHHHGARMLKNLFARLYPPAIDFTARLDDARQLELAGRHDAAAECYRQILEQEPAHIETLLRSGRLEGMRGNLELARRRLETALARDPNLAQAHADLGNVRQLSGDAVGAEEAYETALALDPTLAVAWNNLGLNRLAAGEIEAAAAAFAKALEHAPQFVDAMRNVVSAGARLGRYGEMRGVLQNILVASPRDADAHAALGFIELQGFAQPARALEHFDLARDMGLNSAELLTNRGIALHDLGRIDEAVAAYDAALAMDPQYRLARFHRSLARLIEHRFEQAWEDYEARDALAAVAARASGIPRWDGGELTGKTLLILAEQGLGDEIMFASCFAEVIACAKHCVIDCAPKLAPIFRRSFPAATIHGGTQGESMDWLQEVARPDVQTPAGSLPRFLRPGLTSFPARAGYLKPDQTAAARWRARLAALGNGARIGVSWRGGTAQSRSGMRSLALQQLAPLFALRDRHFVSLQFDASAAEVAAFCQRSGFSLAHFDQAMADYDETAALVSSLDLVLSVCTAVIHLAGAIGTPVWVMAPRVPEWRYGIGGETMPWYPGNRVLRQATAGDWDGLIQRVAGELAGVQPRLLP
jgi:Flp pilus assembly protein TadD